MNNIPNEKSNQERKRIAFYLLQLALRNCSLAIAKTGVTVKQATENLIRFNRALKKAEESVKLK